MKLVYKDIDSLMKQIGNVLVKNRIEHATPPMNVDFKEQQIDSIEMDFGDNEQIIDDAMEIIKDETARKYFTNLVKRVLAKSKTAESFPSRIQYELEIQYDKKYL